MKIVYFYCEEKTGIDEQKVLTHTASQVLPKFRI